MTDLLAVCDAVAARIAAAWPVSLPPLAAGACARRWQARYGPRDSGAKITVFPVDYAAPDILDRSADLMAFRCSVVFAERYTGERDASTGLISLAWLDARFEACHKAIWQELQNAGAGDSPAVAGLYCSAAECIAAYIPEELDQNNIFWSEFEFTFEGDAG